MMAVATEFMQQEAHPSVVIGGYMKALQDMLDVLDKKIWFVVFHARDMFIWRCLFSLPSYQ